MSTQKKGPDPLNRLFDPPPSPGLMPLPPVESGEDNAVVDPADIDSVMSEARRAHPPTPTLSPLEDVAPASPAAPAVDPRELAKMLAKAAAAKARAQAEAPPPPAPVAPPASGPWTPMQSGRPPGSRLANLPMPSAAPPAAPEAKAAPAPVAPAPVAPAPVTPEVKGSRLAAMPMPVKPKTSSEVLEASSRLASLAPPPARKKSAAEVLEEMSRNPQPVAAPAKPAPPAPVAAPAPAAPAPAAPAAAPAAAPSSAAAALATALLQSTFPASGGFQLVNQLPVEDREVQKALWRGHRARFFATGAVEHAIAASSVIAALGRPGTLIVAKVASGSRDWLVWVDGQQGCCIAAFPDAGVWFTGI